MRSAKIVTFLLTYTLVIFASSTVMAQWVIDGVAVGTGTQYQQQQKVVEDASGGAIIVWADSRNGSSNWDIFAQRVDARGNVLWTSGGVAICTATGMQESPEIVSDGSGGAIIVWQDSRGSDKDLYAQRVTADGAVQWTTDGVPICTATGEQGEHAVVTDGVGGAVIVWSDLRSGYLDIYAQRIDHSGTIRWTSNGIVVCSAANFQSKPDASFDKSGYILISWLDSRSGQPQIYAQKIDTSGVAAWTGDGKGVRTSPYGKDDVYIVSNDHGCAMVIWVEEQSDPSYNDINANFLDSYGDTMMEVATIASSIMDLPLLEVVSDGKGGAILAWYQASDIHAQRLINACEKQWGVDGVVVSSGTVNMVGHTLTGDGTGGAVIAWVDIRYNEMDVFSQRVDRFGNKLWSANGIAVTTYEGEQYVLESTTDGDCGAIIVWRDHRVQENHGDIYAQKIEKNGFWGDPTPVIYSVRDVPGDQGGFVYLSWFASTPDISMDSRFDRYTLWRAINATDAERLIAKGAKVIESLPMLGSIGGVDSSKPVIRKELFGSTTIFWELVDTQQAYYLDAYSKTLATLFDSTDVCTEYHYFQIIAHTDDPTIFWKSSPDSGYSVDNLSPCTPQELKGVQSFVPEGLEISWQPNEEEDLANYAIYRGLSEDFEPSPSNLIAEPCDTFYFDEDWRWDSGFYYKVAAVDIHGNESGYALLGPDDVTGEEDWKVPNVNFLAQNYPNPFNPTTRIAFGLEKRGSVDIRIFDARGRLVRILVATTLEPGKYEVQWDGRDRTGKFVGSGVYFIRMNTGSFVRTRKAVLLR